MSAQLVGPSPNLRHPRIGPGLEAASPDRDYASDLRANHLARDHDLHPAILLPAGRGVIGSHRLSLAEALRRDRARGHSRLRQVIAHRRAALFGKLLIIAVPADAVRV